MKNITIIIILSILSEIFIFPQFKIKETIEVKVNYENEFIQKPLKILIVSEDDDKDIIYSCAIKETKSSYIFYDVEPGRYYLGVEFIEKLYLIEVLVGLNMDETGLITPKYFIENEIEVRQNRNLKVSLNIKDSISSSGFLKKSEFKFRDFDFVEIDLYINVENNGFFNKNGDSEQGEFNIENDFSYDTKRNGISPATRRVNKTLTFKYNNISGNSYSHYFDDCGYCRTGSQSGPLKIEDIESKYLLISDIEVWFILESIKRAPIGSKDEEHYRLGAEGGNIGANRFTFIAHKDSLNCSTISCIKDDCGCKFKCIPDFVLETRIRYYDCSDLRQLGDKVKIAYLDENNQKKFKTLDYYDGVDADCVCQSLVNAVKEHEMLHCAQYDRTLKDWINGGEVKGMLQNICNKFPKYRCKNDGDCNSKIEKAKSKFKSLINKFFHKKLDKKELKEIREIEAHDYMYSKFNEFYNACKKK